MQSAANTQRLLRAQHLAQEEDRAGARALVLEALRQDRQDDAAWWALAQLAASEHERLRAVQQVLRLRPGHPHAQHLLDQIRAGTAPALDPVPSLGDLLSTDDQPRRDRARKAAALDLEEYAEEKRKPQRAQQKISFGAKVAFTILIYMIFQPAGLVLNLIFWKQAKDLEKELGYQPEYAGCLSAMLALVLLPVFIIVGFSLLSLVLSLLSVVF